MANTYYCYSNMFVTFSWNAKYYSPMFWFFRVDFIKFTSSFIFFLSTWSTLACTYSYSYSSIRSSFYFSELIRLLFIGFFYSMALLIKGKFGCFLFDPDRLLFSPFSFLGSYFFIYSFFFWFTPELFCGGGGGNTFLSGTGTLLLFWIGLSFFMFFRDYIFWMCYLEN